ncbi:MAG TPA: beta-ketoacyl synthase N-terminal-like domain-containing protein [Polyangia bacterium]
MIEDVVITGAGCVTARAPAAPALLRPDDGAAAAGPQRLPEPLPRPAAWACKPPRLGRMDRFSQVALLAAHEAFAAARLGDGAAGEALGVVLGTAFGCHAVNEEFYRGLLAGGPAGASPLRFAATLPSTPAGEIAIAFGARGPALTFAHGWDAGLGAIAEGARLVGGGRAAAVLAGGADVLSPTLEELLGDWGYGLAPAEGAAFVALERATAAAARGAPALAIVRGAGAAFGPAPGRRTALAQAARLALAEAGVAPGALTAVLCATAPEDDLGALAPLGLGATPAPFAPALGVTFGAGGPAAVVQAALGGRGATLVCASDPLGGATALVLTAAGVAPPSTCGAG